MSSIIEIITNAPPEKQAALHEVFHADREIIQDMLDSAISAIAAAKQMSNVSNFITTIAAAQSDLHTIKAILDVGLKGRGYK